MSVLIVAALVVILLESLTSGVAPLHEHRWHFRAMLALFWAVVAAIYAADRLNLAPALYFQGVPRFASDALTYQDQATTLADRLRAGSFSGFLDPQFFNYSRLLALLYLVFGAAPVLGSVFNAVFYMSSLIAIFLIARQMFGDRTALVAAWLFAVSPAFLLHESQTLRWAMTTAALHVGVLGTLFLVTSDKWKLGAVLGLAGFAVLVTDLPYIARLFTLVVACFAVIPLFVRSLGTRRYAATFRLAIFAAILMVWYQATWPPPTISSNVLADEWGARANLDKHHRKTRLVIDQIVYYSGLSPILNRVVAPALMARTGFIDDANALRASGIELGTSLSGYEIYTFGEFVDNLPAAFRNALFEPTIPRLFSNVSSSSRLRRFASVDMSVYYIVLALAVAGVVLSARLGPQTSVMMIFIVLLTASSYALLGTTILNGGTLHRMRQPYAAFHCVFEAVALTARRERAAATRS